MTYRTIAVLSAGNMGSAVGGVLRKTGYDVVTCLAGRSAITRERAAAAGLRDLPDPAAVVAEASLILSILPPALAIAQARQVAAAMKEAGRTPAYVDCNAVAPDTARAIAGIIAGTGAAFIDGGIVGPPPTEGETRLYVSGHDAVTLEALGGNGLVIKPCGEEPGRASAIKMCYAALTKGTNALQVAVLAAAEAHGITAELTEEFAFSQAPALARMEKTIPRLPADAGRYIGEMEEIAATFDSVGVTPLFHRGAAQVYRLLAQTPFAAETRETRDKSRTARETISSAVLHLSPPRRSA